ncbi:MAG: hypothetical protein IIB29_12155, partial [Chloroflexi bacterium]|nr:hypothetical protein [Chloroflexota bacterium]
MKKTLSLGLLMAMVLLLAMAAGPVFGGSGGRTDASGFRSLIGYGAASFVVPDDMELVKSFDLSVYGLTYERYQQFFGTAHAEVLGGQISLFRDDSGEVTTVLGNHYPNITATNSRRRSKDDAGKSAEQDVGRGERVTIDLLINPATGRYFHRVETRSFDSRWFHWIDADNGKVLNKYNGLETGSPTGIGVKGDTKVMTGITTAHGQSGHGGSGSHFDLSSSDGGSTYNGRQRTFDYRNKDPFLYYATDSDDHWILVTSNRKSPGQPALN